MTKKIAVSLPDRTLARAKAVVSSGRAESVSGYIASLIDTAADEESLLEMTARWNREDGRSAEEIQRGEAAVRAAFARAGLVPERAKREKAPRTSR